MIYRSNLTCPDLTPYFKHLTVRPMPHSFGHSVPSDWADKADDDPIFGQFKNCGMWTHDEAAILYRVCFAARGSPWVDIGCHTGWTTAHIGLGVYNGSLCMPFVQAVDPMLELPEFRYRFESNMNGWPRTPWAMRSDTFFAGDWPSRVRGAVIDGCHEDGQPQRDALNAAKHLADTGVIMFHDGVGRPVREAVEYLQSIGFKTRAYFTPHLVFCCWRGDFAPPDHEPDPEVKRQLLDGRFRDFDFTRCE